MTEWLLIAIVSVCLLNLVRMAAYLLSSDFYTVKNTRRVGKQKRWHLPTVSIVVPAHNEEMTVVRSLASLYESDYPAAKYEVIVVNDGSTDRTREVVEQFIVDNNDRCYFRLINRLNMGKAAALNHALRYYAKNDLVMCLDSDSYLEKNSLRNAVQHFRDRDVVALSSNVNIIEDGSMLSLIQRFEYLVCYQMKKGQALLKLEYIVGGIGSMFRRSMMEKVSFYDTNTMTEDIDLTMKIIVSKDKKQKIAYASDSIVYTEAAHSIVDLLRQRFRWKYGRTQTFLKNSTFFFTKNRRYAKRLSWLMLPFALLQDFIFFFEPLVIGWLLYSTLLYGDTRTFAAAVIVLTAYLLFNLWSADHLSIKERLRLTYYAPPMYLLMYVLSFAEYFALLKAFILLPKLKRSVGTQHIAWNSPKRRQPSTIQV